jgi:alpha-ketoglutarate-dependent taurine dioxygenase
VFFRKQDGVTNEVQKQLIQRLGELSGKPATSKLHIHPVIKSKPEDPDRDDEVTVIDSSLTKLVFGDTGEHVKQSRQDEWHSDVTFEPVPPDYALLRLTQLPINGGGTYSSKNY